MQEMNVIGRQVMDEYQDIGLGLETLAYTDPNHFTLYFPVGSG